jgi:hypothetical protein
VPVPLESRWLTCRCGHLGARQPAAGVDRGVGSDQDPDGPASVVHLERRARGQVGGRPIDQAGDDDQPALQRFADASGGDRCGRWLEAESEHLDLGSGSPDGSLSISVVNGSLDPKELSALERAVTDENSDPAGFIVTNRPVVEVAGVSAVTPRSRRLRRAGAAATRSGS